VVGDPDGLVVTAVVGDHHHDRPEDLFARDLVGVADVGEHRGLDEPAPILAGRATATSDEPGTGVAADVDVSHDAPQVMLAGHRAAGGRGVERVAHGLAAEERPDRFDHLLVARARREDAALGGTGLPVVHERCVGQALGQHVEIGVLEHHGRGLAAQFQGAAADQLAALGPDDAPGRRRPGEGDLVDQRVGDERETGSRRTIVAPDPLGRTSSSGVFSIRSA
jgi:hypothetical protein